MNTGELLASNISYIAQINTLGHAVLIETLKMAAYYVSHSNNANTRNLKTYLSEAKSCYMFVQGSGLELTLNRFGMDYNAGKIKSLFNYLIRQSI